MPLRDQLGSVRSAADVAKLVQDTVKEKGTPYAACQAIVTSYRTTQPSEREMMNLSVIYQGTEGGAEDEAFAALSLWLCAIESLCAPFAPTPTMKVHEPDNTTAELNAVTAMKRATAQLEIKF